MKTYPDRIGSIIPRIFGNYFWHGDRSKNQIYLTFDDGPTPGVTDFVLDQLKEYACKGTFFCIGDRVRRFPQLLERLQQEGHAVGNHTHQHLNAWKTRQKTYIHNVDMAAEVIPSLLFRPPYGRITPSLGRRLRNKSYQIVMWDLLSGDFDQQRSADSCLANLMRNTRNGSVVVFHDSEKSANQLKEILPPYLQFIRDKGWDAVTIPQADL
ncbi:polysaccharide deacetylase family protein [Nonlabens xiamenensis]|uniref:polysaccharide deacetylase family protein n=1 Tax=Nonlabens xiamenensis TaxID=2341043 RepID=UPI000F609137|nr:polysaccharide deacetylase family protein [Nonlabens xiamenensis]